jgi:hypothetical protein
MYIPCKNNIVLMEVLAGPVKNMNRIKESMDSRN